MLKKQRFFRSHYDLFELFPGDISGVVRVHPPEGVLYPVLVLRADWPPRAAAEAAPPPRQTRGPGVHRDPDLPRRLLGPRLVHLVADGGPVNQVGPHCELEKVLLGHHSVSVAQTQSHALVKFNLGKNHLDNQLDQYW